MTQCARRKEIGHGENADEGAGPDPALAIVVVESHERIQHGRQEVSVNHQALPVPTMPRLIVRSRVERSSCAWRGSPRTTRRRSSSRTLPG